MKIVVVGAGVIGLGCAYELVQDGHQVTVLDRGRPGAGVSHGNAAKIALAEVTPVPAPGMVIQGLKWMLHPDSPLYVKPSFEPDFVRFMVQMARHCTERQFRAGLRLQLRLAQTANDLLDGWQADGLRFEMHRRGVLLAYENSEHFHARLRFQDVFAGSGEHAEILDADGVHRVEPALSDRIRHGLFYRRDRQVEPDSLTSALVSHVEKLGAVVRQGVEVVGFERSGRRVHGVITAERERLPCGAVVLAAGVWTRQLSARLGVALPLLPGKGYSVDYTPAPLQLRTSLTLEDAQVAVTPLDGMVRLAGTMEFSGYDATVNPRRVAAISRAASTAFRDWDPGAPHRPAWAGMRPMTPDGLPVVGPLADDGNVWVASGHGMLGLTLAPGTAQTIRHGIRGDTPPDPETSPARFDRRRNRRLSAKQWAHNHTSRH